MDDDLQREMDSVLELGREVELLHYKMREELPAADIDLWSKHFAAANLLYVLCHKLAKGTPQENMVEEILEAYTKFGKPYNQEPRPKF